LIGAPLGLLFARASFPLKRMLRIALVAPLVVPPYILALAWIYIGGPTGIVARLFGRDSLSEWTYSLAGAVVVLGVGFYPLAMLATEAAARRVDGRLEEAALLVAPRSRVLRRITLPLVAPSVVASALIAFVLAISEFGVPGLLRVNVYTTEVFTAFSALYDFGAATALAIPLIAAALIAGTAAQFLIGENLLVTRRGARAGLRLPSEYKTIVVLIALLAITVCVLLPLVALACEAGQAPRIAKAAASSRTAINNSLWLAAAGATIATILGALLGYGRARARTRLRGLADLAMIVMFAVPSTVVGVGLIGMWNRPGFGIYGSHAMVVIAYLARFVPVAALILAASVRQAPVSFEESAELSGAGWLRIFTRIVAPQIKTGIAAAWGACLPLVRLLGLDSGVVFCRRQDFEALGGFDEDKLVAEDVDFLLALKRRGARRGERFVRLAGVPALFSTRKFDEHGDWFFLPTAARLAWLRLVGSPRAEGVIRRYWYTR